MADLAEFYVWTDYDPPMRQPVARCAHHPRSPLQGVTRACTLTPSGTGVTIRAIPPHARMRSPMRPNYHLAPTFSQFWEVATVAMARKCAVHTHLAIVPIEVHHVWPLGEGGPNLDANKVIVCSNGHSAIHDLLAKILKDKAPWSVRIHYGWRINRIAATGARQVKAARASFGTP